MNEPYDRDYLREELKIKRRILHEAEMRLARYGSGADPAFFIQRDDLRAEVQSLERVLGIERPAAVVPSPRRYEPPPVPRAEFERRINVIQERERQREIEHQINLLTTHRRNLAHYRAQARAFGGIDLAPPMTRNGMHEQISAISRIKSVLRDYGVAIEDLAGDE